MNEATGGEGRYVCVTGAAIEGGNKAALVSGPAPPTGRDVPLLQNDIYHHLQV